jgi:hypothetical protein
MMVNKQKIKGSKWEYDFVKLLEENLNGKFKRIPGSGAIGTILKEPLLTSDVIARVHGLEKEIRFDAKVGYGGATQLTVKKEWLDKIRMEAENTYSIPALACKLSGARKADGVQYFIVLDFENFCGIIDKISNLKKEIDLVYKKLADG